MQFNTAVSKMSGVTDVCANLYLIPKINVSDLKILQQQAMFVVYNGHTSAVEV